MNIWGKKIQLWLKVPSEMYRIYNLDAMKLLLEYGEPFSYGLLY